MNYLNLFLLPIILIGCKKKTFADDIVLTNNSKIETKFQEFNEGVDEYGSSIIYVGKIKDSIPIKYYDSMFPAPPPPPNFYLKTESDKKDSIVFNEMRKKYFLDDFDRIQFSTKPIKFDSLTNDILEIVVKPKDTIPHFAIDSTNKIKAYKSFPVFIKNISGKKLILPEMKSLATFVHNKNDNSQLIWNDNAFICGDSTFNRRFWILNPDEVIIFSVNYFQGKEKTKFRIGLTYYFLSEEFEGYINPKLFEQQRMVYEIK